jgi:hypothetical protein
LLTAYLKTVWFKGWCKTCLIFESVMFWNWVLLSFEELPLSVLYMITDVPCLPLMHVDKYFPRCRPPTTGHRALVARPSRGLSPILSLLAENKANHWERVSCYCWLHGMPHGIHSAFFLIPSNLSLLFFFVNYLARSLSLFLSLFLSLYLSIFLSLFHIEWEMTFLAAA